MNIIITEKPNSWIVRDTNNRKYILGNKTMVRNWAKNKFRSRKMRNSICVIVKYLDKSTNSTIKSNDGKYLLSCVLSFLNI